jgi:hypothetical protein
MLILPQIGFMNGNGGIITGNDAVQLWDGVSPTNSTYLYETSDINNPIKLPSQGTLSCWLRRENWSGGSVRLFSTSQNYGDERGVTIELINAAGSSAYISIRMLDVNGGGIMAIATAADFVQDTSWQHLLISWSAEIGGGNSRARASINDLTSVNATWGNLGRTPFERGTFWINQQTDSSSSSPLSLYDLWVSNTEYDVTDIAVKRKFIDGSGNPVDLGSDGSIPFSSQPRLFYSGNFSNWLENKGTLSNADLLIQNTGNFIVSPTTP